MDYLHTFLEDCAWHLLIGGLWYKFNSWFALYKPLKKDKIASLIETFLLQSNEENIVEEQDNPETAPVIDLEQAASLMASDIDVAHSMLELIVADLPQNKKEFEEAYNDQEWKLLQKRVHKLHGATSYCGTPRLKVCCRNFERALDNRNASVKEISPLFEVLQDTIDEVINKFKVNYSGKRK